jgi:hypothetical protein
VQLACDSISSTKALSECLGESTSKDVRTPGPSEYSLITFNPNQVLKIVLRCFMGAKGPWESLASPFLQQRIISECLGDLPQDVRTPGPSEYPLITFNLSQVSQKINRAPTLHGDKFLCQECGIRLRFNFFNIGPISECLGGCSSRRRDPGSIRMLPDHV